MEKMAEDINSLFPEKEKKILLENRIFQKGIQVPFPEKFEAPFYYHVVRRVW